MIESESGNNVFETDSSDTTNFQQHLNAGLEAETQLDRWTAIDEYRKAFLHAGNNKEVCFRLAYNLDLVGEDEEALSLYEQCCEGGPAKINALINLAILYEDKGMLAKAEKCLKQILDTNPNHERAKLFMKDVLASKDMFYAEDVQKILDRQTALLETPITDFELSVRARNCLIKMNIRSTGDLLRTSEAQLMAYKNFGETTLMEIKAMLTQKGLKLGQNAENQHSTIRQELYDQLLAEGNEDLINISVSELNLSIRAQKALGLLDINSIGELISHTEAELLGIKNFGTTSLDEIKEKLEEKDLSLRELD